MSSKSVVKISEKTGFKVFGPLYRTHLIFGGYYGLYKDLPIPPFASSDFIDYLRNNHSTDSNDIIICSPPKSGSHWMKKIVLEILKHAKSTQNHPIYKSWSNNIGMEMPLIENMGSQLGIKQFEKWQNKYILNGDKWPRISQTHLPYNLFAAKYIDANTKLIVLWRNPKDIAVSYHNFLITLPDMEWNENITMNDGIELYLNGLHIFGDYWEYIKSWNNVLTNKQLSITNIYYEDLLNDPLNNIIKIAKGIGYGNNDELNDEDYINIINKTSFKNMKQYYIKNEHDFYGETVFKSDTFFRSGQVNDWKNYFSKEMSHLYDQKTRIQFNTHQNIKYFQQL